MFEVVENEIGTSREKKGQKITSAVKNVQGLTVLLVRLPLWVALYVVVPWYL